MELNRAAEPRARERSPLRIDVGREECRGALHDPSAEEIEGVWPEGLRIVGDGSCKAGDHRNSEDGLGPLRRSAHRSCQRYHRVACDAGLTVQGRLARPRSPPCRMSEKAIL